ncbi:hypothetical protein OEZ85_014334 [Tetradesmus obliquus]|uniref:1-phosphatidylinositol-4-phosphate 5-kinase n=1 Tax=Tetradesmus obliquus TaxID=3088 RepID=A0ABY8UAM4_TETOB|nr:hypothetical protein OEZ85_014334 [Tetradesmus obliquus]
MLGTTTDEGASPIIAVPKIKQRKFANGDKYVGGWLKGLPEGEGRYEWADGSSYEGGWKEGAKHGVGRYIWNSGASYQGEWHSGCMHGVGYFEAPDGSKYQGGWKEDLKHGLGRKVYANGDVYEGLWAAGKPDGPGRYIWVDFNEYDGEWRQGRMSGQGTFVWKTGERYDGEWKDGQEDGVGVFTFRDGSTYSGTWRAGRKHGPGIYRPAALSASPPQPLPQRSRSLMLRSDGSGSRTMTQRTSESMGGRSAFADKAAEAAALPDEAAAEHAVLSPSSSVKYNDFAVGSEPTAGSKGAGLDKQGSAGLAQQQPLQPQPPNKPASDVVLVKEYKDGKLMHTYPLKAPKLAAISAALNEGPQGKHAARSSSSKAAAARVVTPLGEVVFKGHSAYDLAAQLQLGIRWSVGERFLKEQGSGAATLLIADYSAAFKQTFPRCGSSITPVHAAADFQWKDYAPAVFKVLRELSGISQSDYVSQLCSDQALAQLAPPAAAGSGSRPGALFFISRDERFLLKSVTRGEARKLLSLLPGYTQHMARYPSSLLSRFYGLHRIACTGGRKVRFVVMQNLFCSELAIHRRYDLKGSTMGRSVGEEAAEADMTTTLKDLDLHNCFKLEEGPAARLSVQLEADTAFLAGAGLMDYSLLLGVHYSGLQGQTILGQAADGNFNRHSPDAALADALARLQARLPALQLDVRLSNALLQLARARMLGGLGDPSKTAAGGSSSRLALIGRYPTSMLAGRPARGPLPPVALQQKQALGQAMPAVALPPPQQRSVLVSSDGEQVQGEAVVLYFGLIDILQAYTFRKKLEGGMKRLTAPAASVSAVAPRYYASRFRKFMAQVFN